MAAEIRSISKTNSGMWRVVVEQIYWSRKRPARVTSRKMWRYDTTDSVSIDDYNSDDTVRSRRGELALVRQAKWWGDVEYIKG